MSRDAKLKLAIIAFTALIGGGLAFARGLRFPWSDGFAPFAVVAVFGPSAMVFHRRRVEPFSLSLQAAMHVLVFTACFTVLMYAVATFSPPLIDDALLSADATLGIDVSQCVLWANDHPQLHRVIIYAYNSTFIQSLAVILILGFREERRPLELFVLRFMLALLITATVFACFPAKGPFAIHQIAVNPTQASYLQQLEALRAGTLQQVSLKTAEGLVTFPSFHTTWAILLACAVRHNRWLLVPFALLNALVIVGTLTTGWHYFVDVLAGATLAAVIIVATNRLYPWLDRGRQSQIEPSLG